MEKVIIHIGYHKSASTFLQGGFFRQLPANYESLARIPDSVADQVQFSQMIDYVESETGFCPDTFKEWITASIQAGDSYKPEATTIISHEELSGHPHGYALIDPFVVANNLKKTFPNAKIVAVIRNQFDYLTSLYTYRVSIRGHESRSFERFLKEEGNKGLFGHVEYHRLIEHYIELYGVDRVMVLPLEQLRQNPVSFFDTMANFMGLAMTSLPDFRPKNESTRVKVILSIWRPLNFGFKHLLRILLILSGKKPSHCEPEVLKVYPLIRIRYPYYRFKRNMTKRLNKLFPNGKKIDIQKTRAYPYLLRKFGKSNAKISNFGVVTSNLEKLGYPIER